ncbi:MAG: hypothetical protein AAFU60_01410, partial [Bacteroidota bacterium]
MHCRLLFLVFLCSFWVSGAQAQIIITYIEGAASWKPASAAGWEQLETGQTLPVGGIMQVEKESELHFLSSGIYFRLQDAGQYEVKKLLRVQSPSVATAL